MFSPYLPQEMLLCQEEDHRSPRSKKIVPWAPAVRTFIAHQLQRLWNYTADYPRHHSTRNVNIALIRRHTGCHFPTGQEKQELETWLCSHGAPEAPTEEDWCECAYARLRALGIERPGESELRRMDRAALHSFFDDLYQRATARLSETVRVTLDELLVVGPDETPPRLIGSKRSRPRLG
jgi:hypothetical protein